MKHYGTKLNSSSYSLVSEGGAKIFENSKQKVYILKHIYYTFQSQVINQADVIISRLNNTQSYISPASKPLLPSIKEQSYYENTQLTNNVPTDTHQYLVKKFGSQFQGNQPFDIDELIRQISDVFCIVCEQYIPEAKIDQHCKYCSAKPQNEVEQIESVQAKLQKCNYLLSRVKKLLKMYSSDQQQMSQYIQLLWKCVSEIILSTTQSCLESLIQDLELFFKYFLGRTSSDIYIEKLTSQVLTVIVKLKDFGGRKLILIEQGQVLDYLRQSIAQQDEGSRNHSAQPKSEEIKNPFNLKTIPITHDVSLIQNSQRTSGFSPIRNQREIQSKKVNEHSFASNLSQIQKDHSLEQSMLSQKFTNNILAVNESYAQVIPVPEESSYQSSNNGNASFRDQLNAALKGNNQGEKENEQSKHTPNLLVQHHSPLRTFNQQYQSPQHALQQPIIAQKTNDKKSTFFTLAAELKLSYPKAQSVLVAEMFDKANKKGIQQAEYQGFIKAYYEQL